MPRSLVCTTVIKDQDVNDMNIVEQWMNGDVCIERTCTMKRDEKNGFFVHTHNWFTDFLNQGCVPFEVFPNMFTNDRPQGFCREIL